MPPLSFREAYGRRRRIIKLVKSLIDMGSRQKNKKENMRMTIVSAAQPVTLKSFVFLGAKHATLSWRLCQKLVYLDRWVTCINSYSFFKISYYMKILNFKFLFYNYNKRDKHYIYVNQTHNFLITKKGGWNHNIRAWALCS